MSRSIASFGPSWRFVPRHQRKPNIFAHKGIRRILRVKDWFHTALHMRTYRLIAVLGFVYISIVCFYALVYLGIDATNYCNLGLNLSFRSAFFFSLETHATIGYGVPDQGFNDCWIMILALWTHVFISLLLDATLIGILWTRMGRGSRRAISIVFSDQAIIVEHNGATYLLLQVFDKRRDGIVEANVRLFCYVHDKFGENAFPSYRALKLVHPDLDDGGVLLLCSPTMVIHRLDHSSPIMRAAELAAADNPLTDARGVLGSLACLEHFEIIVEVNGIEVTSSAQVQARWSYVLEEVQYAGDSRLGDQADCIFSGMPGNSYSPNSGAIQAELCNGSVVESMHFESPAVEIIQGMAHVQRSAVVSWQNTSQRHLGQLSRALDFYIPQAAG